ncbi:hypothetical protein cypCar_00044217, partial [Cyprinus carpio]
MEMRRQVTVSWDSGNSDEAPPKPSRPGYPSPRSSDGYFPSPQHSGQHNHYQGSGYPGAHVPGAGYPPQASVLDPHETWNHHRQEVPVWSPNMEKPESRNSRGSIDREDSALQAPMGKQHVYQPVGKAEHVAPPKKPPRPGAPSHLTNLNPVDSYNEGVK